MSLKQNNTFDSHHICFPKSNWENKYAKKIRTHWYFIIKIPKDTVHQEIHRNIPSIPVPNEYSAKRIYTQILFLENNGMLSETDSIQKRIRLLVMLFDNIEQPTSEALKEQLEIIQDTKSSSI